MTICLNKFEIFILIKLPKWSLKKKKTYKNKKNVLQALAFL